MIFRRKRTPATPPSEGRWRIEPYLDSDNDWCAAIYDEEGHRQHRVSTCYGYSDHARKQAIIRARDWCDRQDQIREAREEADKARAAGGGVIWYGDPSVKSLQKRIQDLEKELDL